MSSKTVTSTRTDNRKPKPEVAYLISKSMIDRRHSNDKPEFSTTARSTNVFSSHRINHRQPEIADETGNTYIAKTITVHRCRLPENIAGDRLRRRWRRGRSLPLPSQWGLGVKPHSLSRFFFVFVAHWNAFCVHSVFSKSHKNPEVESFYHKMI